MDQPAAALLDRFAVYGRFYSRPIAGVEEMLRDRLEIVAADMPLEVAVSRGPDLLVVMMNPGASKPLDALWDGERSLGFVSAQPDRTQHQIMRLLLVAQSVGLGWQHARILNLSDLRTPKSAVFIEKLNAYVDDDSHSIFSESRRVECAALFASLTTPVLCGWGLSAKFQALAGRALAASVGHPLLGITSDGLLYRHPLPQRHDFQVQWLAQVAGQIAELAVKRR